MKVVLFILVAVLAATVLAAPSGIAGTNVKNRPLGVNHRPRQSACSNACWVKRVEQYAPTQPPPYEVKKFRTTKAQAKVRGFRILACHLRDSLHKSRRVCLGRLFLFNPPHNPDYGKMRFKIYTSSGRQISSREILGLKSFGFIDQRTSSFEDVVPYRFARIIKFVLSDQGEKGYCIRGGFVPKQCSS